MFSRTLSVPQAIREILSSNNLYLQALLSGIANYTALAQKIKPEVERLTTSSVNTGTIVVAIKRIVDGVQREEETRSREGAKGREDGERGAENRSNFRNIFPIIEGVRMSLTGSMMDIDFNESKFKRLSDIFDEIFDKEISHNYNVFQTDKQIRLLAEDIQEIRNIIASGSKKFDGSIKGGLSKITITLPPINEGDSRSSNKYYRFISSISDIIYNSRINLHDAFFTPREIVLVLNDSDALRAYELLRATIAM
jgi:hypothetical protein